MKIFQEILDCKSMTVIGYKAEDALAELAPEGNEPQRQALSKIVESRQLDEIYALAHEQLGNFEEAKKLREWMAYRKPMANPDIDCF